MLIKIKDNVKWEELENKGFSHTYNNEDELYIDVKQGWVCINKKTREIFVSAEIQEDNLEAGTPTDVYDIGIIYDLIKENIAEKVEEK